jgi:hypothetical protein
MFNRFSTFFKEKTENKYIVKDSECKSIVVERHCDDATTYEKCKYYLNFVIN